MNPGLSSFLNLARWMAAWLVVCGHVRNIMLADMPDVHAPGPAIKALSFVTGFGHQAVIIFFVISGFLVGGMTLEKWASQRPNLVAYFIARISRIHTVLVPALIIGWVFDTAGARWFDASGLYTGALSQLNINSVPDQVSVRTDWLTALGNALGLQGMVVPTFGTNGPLWSLANEWWYYCLFAFAAVAIKVRLHRTINLLATLAIAVLLPWPMLLWGALWALGLGTHAWMLADYRKPGRATACLAFFAAMAWARLHHATGGMTSDFLTDLTVAITFCLLLVSLTSLNKPLPLARFHHWAAEFSFSTYLFHFPAMVFAAAALAQTGQLHLKGQPTPNQMSLYVEMVLALLTFSFLAYQLFEKRTARVRRALSRQAPSAARNVPLNEGQTTV